MGIPPANKPPSWGASGKAGPAFPLSLLLRARLPPPGTAGAPLGGFSIPGTAGALATGGPEDPPPLPLSIMGAERSFVTVFFNLAPLEMSPRRALRSFVTTGGLAGRPPGGGGGGGGPPNPGGGGGGGGGGGAGIAAAMSRFENL